MSAWLGPIADVLGILSAVFALFAWISALRIRKDQEDEKSRQNQKIGVRVRRKDSNEYFDLPGKMRRAELTRAEVLGWIGMVPRITQERTARFSISYFNSEDFFTCINQIKEGRGDMLLEIECTPAEFLQFDLVLAGLVDHGKE